MLGTSRFSLVVRFYETDLMGVVHHANFLKYFEAGRVDYLKKRGVSYDGWVRQGINLAVAESKVKYRRPARFDDELIVVTNLDELKRASALFSYRIVRGEHEELIAEGSTLLACVGPQMNLVRLPDFVTASLTSAERALQNSTLA
ncbi:MAG: thioesterase family protein, partial [Polyangiaceae bacterium]